LKENNLTSRIFYPAQQPFKIEGGIKIFHDEQKWKQYMTIKPSLQKILKGILHTEDENKDSHERIRIIKPQEKSRQVIESNIELVAHTQTLYNKSN
jgi:hypothetical protein